MKIRVANYLPKFCNDKFFVASFFILLFLLLVTIAEGQDIQNKIPDGTEGEYFGSLDTNITITKKKNWNEFNLHFTTLRVGAGLLYDFVTYAQDKKSKQQSDSGNYSLTPKSQTRDFRVLLSGKFNTKRLLTWKAGFMYDGPSRSWFVRETGLMVGVPELNGNVFIGRTKEGFSLNKVMVGYNGWTMERQMAIDVIPILADGIKYMGFYPKSRIFLNLGAYTDWLSHSQSFSTYKWQVDARVGWLPIQSQDNNNLLHLALNFRFGEPVNGQIKLRSRPEVNPAPYFIDTGTFPADHSTHVGYEAYYTSGPLMIGSEYYLHKFYSYEKQNPLFRGGDFVISYMLTGEVRPYQNTTNVYSSVPVKKPVIKGGIGAIEILLKYSQLNLNDAGITGGKFWRLTPMVNWYLSPMFRLDFAYGYGVLDRYGLKGGTQFFQSRIQIVIL